MDALIVATARSADLTVLTRDKKLARLLGGEASLELYTP
jgi:predicted nucleic acid-binding protein